MKPIITEEKLLELLPTGNGINSDWEITEHKNGNVTAKNSFHAMDEAGFYDGYMPFTVRIFQVTETRINKLKGPCEGQYQIVAKKGDIDFSLSCNDNRQRSFIGLGDSLTDLLQNSLKSILTPLRGAVTEKEVEKWIEKS